MFFYAAINYNVVAGGIMFPDCSCIHVCIRPFVRGLRAQISLKGWRYWQAVNGVINYDLSRVEQKKFMYFDPLTMTVIWLMFICVTARC